MYKRRKITQRNVDRFKIYICGNGETNVEEGYVNIEEFTFNKSVNRAVVKSNVKKFYDLMRKGKFDPSLGLIVIDIISGTIIDGQHRIQAFLDACEKFDYDGVLYVQYVEAPQAVDELQKFIRQYQEGRKWQLEDYISANIGGKNDLQKLRQFCIDHQYLNNGKDEDVYWRKGAGIIAKTGSSEYKKRLKGRNFRFTDEEWADAERSYNEAVDLFNAVDKKWTDGGFEYILNAWKKVRYDMTLLAKICSLPNGIDSFFELLKNKSNYPSGQAEGIWFDFFVETINDAIKNRAA